MLPFFLNHSKRGQSGYECSILIFQPLFVSLYGYSWKCGNLSIPYKTACVLQFQFSTYLCVCVEMIRWQIQIVVWSIFLCLCIYSFLSIIEAWSCWNKKTLNCVYEIFSLSRISKPVPLFIIQFSFSKVYGTDS